MIDKKIQYKIRDLTQRYPQREEGFVLYNELTSIFGGHAPFMSGGSDFLSDWGERWMAGRFQPIIHAPRRPRRKRRMPKTA